MSLYVIIAILIIAVALVGLVPGSGGFFSDGVCRRLNWSPSSPEQEPLSLVRYSAFGTRTSCLIPSRSELAHWWKSRRSLNQHHIPLHQAPI